MYCESDQASLCWDCDSRVHTANFLVAKHTRTLLCHACQCLTPWSGSGPKLGPTVSVCDACVNGRAGDDEEESGDLAPEDDDDDESENQVVPLSLPPSLASSSTSSSDSSSRRDASSNSNTSFSYDVTQKAEENGGKKNRSWKWR